MIFFLAKGLLIAQPGEWLDLTVEQITQTPNRIRLRKTLGITKGLRQGWTLFVIYKGGLIARSGKWPDLQVGRFFQYQR